jgi:trehalose/maltose hydrolase-like predicted phosphorylase
MTFPDGDPLASARAARRTASTPSSAEAVMDGSRTEGRVGPGMLDRTFAAVVCDWDGTLVPDRHAKVTGLRRAIEALCRFGVEVVIVSGTHVGNVDPQLGARPVGPGELHLCLNRGSEVFRVGRRGPELVWRRQARPDEEGALDRAAAATVQRLGRDALPTRVVSQRLNRRKIDLIPDDPRWADPPKARIGDLLEAVEKRLRDHGLDLPSVVAIAEEEARAAGVVTPRVTSDAKHVEIGLTDKSQAATWADRHLAELGIGPGLVLVGGDELGNLGGLPGSDALLVPAGWERATVVSVGVEPAGVPAGVLHLGGGPRRFLQLLDEQVARQRAHRVPEVDEDPAWVVRIGAGGPERSRADESVLTLADGTLGTRGALEEDGPGSTAGVYCAGLYTGIGSGQRLVECPVWTNLPMGAPARHDERVLDLRTGVLVRHRTGTDDVTYRSARCSFVEHPGIVAMRAESDRPIKPTALLAAPPQLPVRSGRTDTTSWMQVPAEPVGGVTTAARQSRRSMAPIRTLERLAAYVPDSRRLPGAAAARAKLDSTAAAGFATLLRGQRQRWAERWRDADVEIPDDPELQQAVRFALFHLLSSAASSGEAAVGARGLTGPGYRGHVFWDADVFVLPALTAVAPAKARAMLEYRVRRLRTARAFAAASGRRGARFPWESARDGSDATPHTGVLAGSAVPILTGDLQQHVVADVAWAAWHYAAWTGDEAFLRDAGYPLLMETARYWVSRVRLDQSGRSHIDRVIGPDEYHVGVDDNAFTNGMARWNLLRAAELAEGSTSGRDRSEADQFRDVAESIVDGYDPETGLYEQFAGYLQLQPLVLTDVARAPVAVDLLLGVERTAATQLIKQPDVLMLHHLVPQAVAAGSLEPNLDYYGPRTAHGSSLSPAIHASLCARAGRTTEALEHLHRAARIDLDDDTGATASGLHLATMGGVWHALAFGLLGLRWDGSGLRVDPRMPDEWTTFRLTCRIRRARVVVRLVGDVVDVTSDRALPMAGRGAPFVETQRLTVPRCRQDAAAGKRPPRRP